MYFLPSLPQIIVTEQLRDDPDHQHAGIPQVILPRVVNAEILSTGQRRLILCKPDASQTSPLHVFWILTTW